MTKLQSTKISLPENLRRDMVELLNRHVVLLTDLSIQTKLAHWNVRGPHFIAYHELFDELGGRLMEITDMVAERAVTLGGTAGVPVQEVAKRTTLPAWPVEQRRDAEVIRLLAERWAVVANSVREAIAASAETDPDTSDLFTEVSRQLDKDLWFIESHLA
ncbi:MULTISPECIES: DNA starvation/stationary phase protection protein Dps [Kyrpidia]|uniref:DNA protection during starvation protein n=1 Tax=Kyrpidia spormannii TaxID=2055160 RepID=A0ACA8Z5M6_9BACL|nr:MULTISPECIES: DNA starvation/stationary phase protection protein Dps [Kyrpidia]MCL6576947.1 DNA starvation/stationary phase protection protein Dps [Kyrpidia sp.]CAB3390011.1 DNA protection during starvation protein [Kyrpidia spormannii]